MTKEAMTSQAKKFQELLDKLNSAKDSVSTGSLAPPESADAGEDIMGTLDEALADFNMSASKKSTLDPHFKDEVIKSNKQVIAMSEPNVPPTDWLVQAIPDDGGVIHFQAKVSPSSPYYLRWYEQVSPEVYDQVSQSYMTAGTLMRGSFYGSAKKYMVCTRRSETEVEILGVGLFTVPELFGLDRK